MTYIMIKFLMVFLSIFGVSHVSAKEPKFPDFKVENGIFIYEKIGSVDLTKLEIVSYSAAFFAEKFKSAKSVIELRDDELGKLIGDVIVKDPKSAWLAAFPAIKTRVIIDAKDGRYRFQATNIVGVDANGKVTTWPIEGANQYRIEPAALSALDELFGEYVAYLDKAKLSDDW